jgi:hypothetical protein
VRCSAGADPLVVRLDPMGASSGHGAPQTPPLPQRQRQVWSPSPGGPYSTSQPLSESPPGDQLADLLCWDRSTPSPPVPGLAPNQSPLPTGAAPGSSPGLLGAGGQDRGQGEHGGRDVRGPGDPLVEGPVPAPCPGSITSEWDGMGWLGVAGVGYRSPGRSAPSPGSAGAWHPCTGIRAGARCPSSRCHPGGHPGRGQSSRPHPARARVYTLSLCLCLSRTQHVPVRVVADRG